MKRDTRVWIAPILAVCVLVCGAACESRHVGQQEAIVFTYDSPFAHETFNKPVVVGGRLEVHVDDLDDSERELRITHVESSAPDVFAITGHVGNMVEIEARGAGSATLTVRADGDGGEALTDRVIMRAGELHDMTLAHVCGEGPTAYMLEHNASFTIDVARWTARGERLSGFGHAPLEVEPAPAHVRAPVLSQSSVEIITRGVQGDVRVSSKFSTQTLLLRRVRLQDITSLAADFGPAEVMLLGEKVQESFTPMVSDEMLCAPTWSMTLQNDTPGVCRVIVGDEEGEGREEGVVTVEALTLGQCRYTVGIKGTSITREVIVSVGRLVFEAPRINAEPAMVGGASGQNKRGFPWWLAPLLALCVPAVLAPMWWFAWRGRGDGA